MSIIQRLDYFRNVTLKAGIPIHSVFQIQLDAMPLVRICVIGNTHYKWIRKKAKEFFGNNGYLLSIQEEYALLSSTVNVGEGIRHPNVMGWGTIGGIFTRPNDPNTYGLSNNHVIANFNQANQGDVIFHTGLGNLGNLHNWFTLVEFPHTNYIDAALVRLRNDFLAQWNPPSPPNGNWLEPLIGMQVVKRGFATGLTHGIITQVNGSGNAGFSGRLYHFSGIIEIEGINGPFSAIGDSGSIVLSWPNRLMVGLLFATSGTKGWALPISRIQGLLL